MAIPSPFSDRIVVDTRKANASKPKLRCLKQCAAKSNDNWSKNIKEEHAFYQISICLGKLNHVLL